MKKVQIQFNENMSKAEELAAWKTFYDNLPAGSYLQLTLNGLGTMVENNIENDFAENPIDGMNFLRGELTKQDLKVKELEATAKHKEDLIEGLQRTIETAKEEAKQSWDKRQEEREAWYSCIEQIKTLEGQLDANKCHYENKLAAKDDEITKLKAKLYDLMVKGE